MKLKPIEKSEYGLDNDGFGIISENFISVGSIELENEKSDEIRNIIENWKKERKGFKTTMKENPCICGYSGTCHNRKYC